MNATTTRIGLVWTLLLALLAGCSEEPRIDAPALYAGIDTSALRPFDYSQATLESAARIPIQEVGRVKPLSTFSDFQLLQLNGRRSIRAVLPTGEARKLSSIEWLLDMWFFPAQAGHYRCFSIDDKAVLVDIGLDVTERKKRDRYSYIELLPAMGTLHERAAATRQIEKKDRSRIERGVLRLSNAVRSYEDLSRLVHAGQLAGNLDRMLPQPVLDELGADSVSALVSRLGDLRTARINRPAGSVPPEVEAFENALWQDLDRAFAQLVDESRRGPALVPPLPEATAGEEQEHRAQGWYDVGQTLLAAIEQQLGEDGLRELPALAALAFPTPQEEWYQDRQWHEGWPLVRASIDEFGDDGTLGVLERFELLRLASTDGQAFEGAVVELERFVRTRADARGDAGKIEMEIGFYERNYFMNALVLFLIGFVAVGLDWLRSTRILRFAAWGASLSGLALLVVGITVRCILLDRPPVATLYETILFIAAGGVATALFIEYAMRRRFFLGVACVLGALGMFLANRYEFQEAVLHGDTARPVVAVLDTNFWLATHVTTITLGYSASLLASVLSIAWLAGRMVEHVVARRGGGSPQANEAHKVRNQAFTDLTRAMYGVVCFGVVLSTVGTILGGIWANDSWGRFWGWDPKENGALLIVLWQLVMLHARLGGFVRQFGLHMLSLILGPVTVFSWWHINNLEIGLHSYGFTEGIEGIVMSYYYVIVAIAAVSLLWYALVGSDAANGRGSGPGGTPGGGAPSEGAQGGDPNPAAS